MLLLHRDACGDMREQPGAFNEKSNSNVDERLQLKVSEYN